MEFLVWFLLILYCIFGGAILIIDALTYDRLWPTTNRIKLFLLWPYFLYTEIKNQ